MRRCAGLAMGLAGIVAAASPAAAQKHVAFPLEMASGEQTLPPEGFTETCGARPDLCGGDRAAAVAPPADEHDRLLLIRRVNHMVNTRVRPRNERGDVWRRTGLAWGASGDCEDYAIEKRAQLLAAGIPAADMYFAVGYLSGEGLHAVLVVHSGDGDLVLDSRSPWISFWADTPYVWLLRQTTTDPTRWTSVVTGNGTSGA